MNTTPPDAADSVLPMHREVLLEEQRLQEALKRDRLVEAAKRPPISKWRWVEKVLMIAALVLANADIKYQYLVNSIVIIYLVYGGDSRVNSRIDALLELAKEDKKKAEAAKEM